MINLYFFIELLIISSTTGSILFLIIAIYSYFMRYYEISSVFLFMKVAAVFYLLPGMFLILGILRKTYSIIITYHIGPDIQSGIQYTSNLPLYFLTSLKMDYVIQILFGIWLIIFIINWVVRSIFAKHLLTRLLQQSEEVKNHDILRLKSNLCRRLSIRRNIQLYFSDMVDTPFSTGILSQKIVFPKMNLSEKEFSYILEHELIHCRRYDVTFKFAVSLIKSIQWFNPLIRLFANRYYYYMELSCDEQVTKDLGKSERLQYARLLLTLSQSNDKSATVYFSGNDEKTIKRRILSIMRIRNKMTKLGMVLSATAFLSLCPLSAVVATAGVFNLQNQLIDSQIQNSSVPDASSVDTFTEYTEYGVHGTIEFSRSLVPRANNNVDFTISSNGTYRFNIGYYSKGTTISLLLSADRSTDSFQVALVNSDSNTRTYVSSQDGYVSHTFTTSSSGNYKIDITGKNGSSGNGLHIVGSIYIK